MCLLETVLKLDDRALEGCSCYWKSLELWKTFISRVHVKVKGENLMVVEKINYLGVQIDKNLEWKGRIKYVSSKVARAIGFLKYTKNFIPKELLKQVV